MNPSDKNLKYLIEQNIQEPEGLVDVEERFEKRFSRENRIRRFKVGSVATSVLLLFMIITANTNMAWAENVRRIPVLKEFLSVMQWEKDFGDELEELGIVSNNGEYEMALQYVVSDEKMIALYLQLSEDVILGEHHRLELEELKIYDLKTKEDYAPYFNSKDIMPSGKNYFALFGGFLPGSEQNFPDAIGIEFTAVIKESDGIDWYNIVKTKSLGQFSFVTKLKKMTSRPINKIDKNLSLLGNNLILRSVESSHFWTTLLFEEDPSNTHRILSISGKIIDAETGKVINDLYLDKETGRVLQYKSMLNPESKSKNGLLIYLSPADLTSSRSIEIIIDGVQLLDKKEEYITLDPINKTMVPKIENMELIKVLTGYKTMVTFKVKSGHYHLLHDTFETGSGEIGSTPSSQHIYIAEKDYYKLTYIFDEDIQDTIILRRSGVEMPIQKLKEPIRIRIEIPEVLEPIP